MPDPQRLAGVLFDLDGTLLDTAPDLVAALDHALRAAGRAPVDPGQARARVSHGAAALIEYGFGLPPNHPDFERHRQRLLAHYRDHLADRTRLFPGMDAVLDFLDGAGLRWGVVTNKPARFTEPLLEALGLRARAAAVVSGDTVPEKKPHPAPLEAACAHLGIAPRRCAYVGDARRDIVAGRRAGMRTAVALYGYLGAEERPERWGADFLAATPEDLLQWIKKLSFPLDYKRKGHP
ncbi:MAG: phosphoglycolate phosphatase [Gammaproteobacteria bacterium]|nr:MAG: phosphoglycolate phosphatase [Gammaproteobacteria bacterium]